MGQGNDDIFSVFTQYKLLPARMFHDMQADEEGRNVLPQFHTILNMSELEDAPDYEDRWCKLKRSIRKFLIDQYGEAIPSDPKNVSLYNQ